MSKRLLVFSIIYSLLTFLLIDSSQRARHGGGEIILLFLPALWVVDILLLFILYKVDKKILKGILNKVLFVIATPIPTLFFLLGYYIWVTQFESQKSERSYKKNGFTVKETHYPYLDRTEYRSNYDSKTGELLLDSVKVYIKEEKQYKTEVYEGWERFLSR